MIKLDDTVKVVTERGTLTGLVVGVHDDGTLSVEIEIDYELCLWWLEADEVEVVQEAD
jgi:hypothetical protein